jgi:hypothetical protein
MHSNWPSVQLTIKRSKIETRGQSIQDNFQGDVVEPLNDLDNRDLLGPALGEPDDGGVPATTSAQSRGFVGNVGQANPNPASLQGAEASTNKQRRSRKRKAGVLQEDDADLADANVDASKIDGLLTAIAEALPLGRRASPGSKRIAALGRRSLGVGQDTIPAVRNLLRALFTRQQAGADKYADLEDEEEGLTCEQCGRRVKRACDMK